MKHNLKKDKRGISIMVSYVLLIVIALGMAAGVFTWMRFYTLSDDTEQCPTDIALTIKDYNCESEVIKLTFENNLEFNF